MRLLLISNKIPTGRRSRALLDEITKEESTVGLLDKILRAGEGRAVKELAKIAVLVNQFESKISALSDDQLRNQTEIFKERIAKGETLDSLLPEAFATVREAAKRTLGQRHYDVQLMGGAALHRGNIAEMRTGEGKTLVSTLPA